MTHAIKVIDQALKGLTDDLTAPERLRLQAETVKEWVTLFFKKSHDAQKVTTCFNRWSINPNEVSEALRHCREKEYTLHELRDEVARSVAELCASKVQAHLRVRNPDNLIPAEVIAAGAESIYQYLNAEHGWKFRATNKAWLAMAQEHPDLLPGDLSQRYLFVHRYIIGASKIDPAKIIRTALVAEVTNGRKIEAPYEECLKKVWLQTFGSIPATVDERRFLNRLSDLIGKHIREEPDDAHISYYVREPQTSEERASKVDKLISNEFMCVVSAVTDLRFSITNTHAELLESTRRDTIREAQKTVSLMRTLFETKQESAPTSRVTHKGYEPKDDNRDIGPDFQNEEVQRPRWTALNRIRGLWTSVSTRLGRILSSQPMHQA